MLFCIQISEKDKKSKTAKALLERKHTFESRVTIFENSCQLLRCDVGEKGVVLENRSLNISEFSLYNFETTSLQNIRVAKARINRFAAVIAKARHLVQSRIRTKCNRIAYEYTFFMVSVI